MTRSASTVIRYPVYVRPRRPKTKTKVCAHCARRRPRLKIEWHPGICEWQCSNFNNCDDAIMRRDAEIRGRTK